MALPFTEELFTRLLDRIIEFSEVRGVAIGGSTTELEDTKEWWPTDKYKDATVGISHDSITYRPTVTSNTNTKLTFAALPVAVAAGDEYTIVKPITVADIMDRAARLLGVIDSLTKWGGTALTGRDISLDLANLNITLSALRDAIVNAATPTDLLDILTQLQATLTIHEQTPWNAPNLDLATTALRDALLAGTVTYPGGLDDIFSKLNTQLDVLLSTRASETTLAAQLNITLSALRDALQGASTKDFSTLETDIESILANIDVALSTRAEKAQLPTDLTTAGNLKQSVEERLISKTIRDIAPGATGTFWLPDTGNIDLSKYLASSWGIYAPTTTNMVINCYLNISHDGGTTWRRAAGYEILDADFVRDAWNTIDCPLKLAETKLEVAIGTAYPAELDLMCIAKP